MPPRFAYWTILVDGLPTAFRAAEREEILPTFKRLLQKHPDAVLRWFSRGQLWDSPDAARAALIEARRAERPPRGRDWRPGGDHRDPRQKFIDAKKTRNVERRKQRFERREKGGAGPVTGDAATTRPPRPAGPAAGPRPHGPAGWRPKAPAVGSPPRGPAEGKDRPKGTRPDGPQGWKEPKGPKPEGRREWTDRPRGPRPTGRPGAFGDGRPSGPRAPRGPRGPKGPRGPRGPKR